MFVEELAAKLGLDVSTADFAKGAAAIEGLRLGLAAVEEIAKFAFDQLKSFTVGVAENALAMDRAAQRSGVGAQAFQELAYAADLSGVSAETMEHSLNILSRMAFEAAQGSHELGFAFRQLGVNVYGAHGKLKPTDELLSDLADRFSRMPDGIRKTALAQQILGRGGAQLLPFLNKGRAGLAELRAEAEKYGVVVDQDVIAASYRWEEQQKHLHAALNGLKNAIGGALLKRMSDVVDKIANWIAAHRELIATRVLDFIDKTIQLLTPLARVIDEVFIKTDAWKYSLIALTAILFLMNAPLLAILGVLLLIEDFYGFLEGKDSLIGRLFPPEMQESIRNFMQEVRDFVKFLFSGNGVLNPNALLEKMGLRNPNAATGALGAPSAAQSANALPVTAFTPAERGESQWQAMAHRIFGNPKAWEGVSLAQPEAPQYIAAPGGGGRTQVNAPITINVPPGMDPKEVANRTADKFNESMQVLFNGAYAAGDQ